MEKTTDINASRPLPSIFISHWPGNKYSNAVCHASRVEFRFCTRTHLIIFHVVRRILGLFSAFFGSEELILLVNGVVILLKW